MGFALGTEKISGQTVTPASGAFTASGVGVIINSGVGVTIGSGLFIASGIGVQTTTAAPSTMFTSAFTITNASGGTNLPSITAKYVTLQAPGANSNNTNSGDIYINGSGLVSGVGMVLRPGDVFANVPVNNTNLFWAFATVSGDKLTYMALN